MNTLFGIAITFALLYIIYKLNTMEELLQRLDGATNEIAADLQALRDQLGNALTPEQRQRLEDNISRLEGLGQDPQNPVPEA